ncbi:MAG: hypothetical protein ACREFP_06945 [Acetobacteraceae bacterium]
MIAAVAPAVPFALTAVTDGLAAVGPPDAPWLAFAIVVTEPVLLLPVALAVPVPAAPNGAPFVPGSWPAAVLAAENEATGLPLLSESWPALLPFALKPAVPDPLAVSPPSDVVLPPNVVVPLLVPIVATAWFEACDAAVPVPFTAPFAFAFEAMDAGPVPIGAVAVPFAMALPVAP